MPDRHYFFLRRPRKNSPIVSQREMYHLYARLFSEGAFCAGFWYHVSKCCTTSALGAMPGRRRHTHLPQSPL